MVSGRRGLKVSQKPLIILVKLSHQNSFPHIHPRAMWSDWCQYNADAQPVSSCACGAVFVVPDTGPYNTSQIYNLRVLFDGSPGRTEASPSSHDVRCRPDWSRTRHSCYGMALPACPGCLNAVVFGAGVLGGFTQTPHSH